MLTAKKNKNIMDTLIIITTIIYYVLTDAVAIIVGREGSRVGGIILIGQLCILLLLYLFKQKWKLRVRLSLFHLYFCFFIGYCVVNCFWSSNRNVAIARTGQLAEYAVIQLIIYTIYDNRKKPVDDLLNIIMIGGFLLVVCYIITYGWSYIVFSIRNAERITSDTINANTLGMAAAYSSVIFIHKFMHRQAKKWLIPFAVISLVIILVSQSRKALLILILGTIGTFILNNHDDKNKLRVFIRIIGIVLIISIVLIILERSGIFGGTFSERMQGLINGITGRGIIDKSTIQRNAFGLVGINLFKEHPIGGVGIDCSRYYTYAGVYGHMHNNYIELLADGGLLGLVAYYWIYVLILASMIKNKDIDNPEFNICFVLLILRIVMDYGYYSYKEQGTYFFLLLFYFYYRKNIIEKKTIKKTKAKRQMSNCVDYS